MDPVAVNKDTPVVNFLENTECTLEESEIRNCYHYVANPQFVRSSKITIVIEGIGVPIILDTGAGAVSYTHLTLPTILRV